MRGHVPSIVLIAALSVGVFANALQNPFVWDDAYIIVRNEGIRRLHPVSRFFTPTYWEGVLAEYSDMPERGYRPLPELLFAVDYALWDYRPLGYRAVNVALHLSNCLLLYALANRFLGDQRLALFCSLLFATHPVHVEPVVWVKARPELLALLFVLVSALLYTRFVSAGRRAASPSLHMGAVVAFGLAMACKVSAGIFPGLLAAYVLCLAHRTEWRRALLGLLPFVGVVLVFFAADGSVPHPPVTYVVPTWQIALMTVIVVGVYLKLLLFPLGLCAHHAMHIPTTVPDPAVLRALPWELALVAAAVVALRRSKVALFAIVWIIIALIPAGAVRQVGRLVGELRLYTPSVGFCLLVAFLLGRLPALGRTAGAKRTLERLTTAACIALVLGYSGLTVTRNMDWASAFSLWSSILERNPDSWYAHKGLGLSYSQAGDHWAAIPHLERARLWAPEERPARYALATAYSRTNQLEKAIAAFQGLVAEDPTNARVRSELALVYARDGQAEAAQAEFQRALRDAPESPVVHRQLGIFLTETGRYREALRELQTALALKEQSPATHYALGLLYERMEDVPAALRAYERCVVLGGAQGQMARARLDELVKTRRQRQQQ